MGESGEQPREATILLVDDQPANLAVLRQLLEAKGYRVVLAPSGQVALRNAARILPDLVLLDVTMPEMDGFKVCRRLRQDPATCEIPVIFITARDTKEDLIAGFEAGGLDYVAKPFQEEEVLVRVRTHVRLHQLARELVHKNEELERQIAHSQQLSGRLSMLAEREVAHWGLESIVGESPTVRRIFQEIHLLQGNLTTSVLITGESGTGKELIARAIHFGSPRREGPFVPVNCAALPGELAESLLFGYVKGAFTGASADQEGYFEMAHQGTLFLDEIGEMPSGLQAKLLRVLEDCQVWRLGARNGKRVEVRVMTATNADIKQRLDTGAFRQDLYFRLAHFTVAVPPLRERREDIPLLARHFLKLFAAEMGREPPPLSGEVLASLQAYGYPGNVRELKNIIERALIESGGGEIRLHHLHFLPAANHSSPATGTAPSPLDLPLDLDQAIEEAERRVVKQALDLSAGNVSAATRLLGTNRNRIYRILGQEKPPAQ
ncbi:MAG: sigma-54-dependent Fis family transcriptional regulator [Candidatus Latescibacteria bacterium]|nr:sigma-54-dependent Fis family transcriptional regulator [Candidatus Latescibacterota bacterium]